MSKKNAQTDMSQLVNLAGGLAHEIKNPLSTISINLAMLREDWAKTEGQREKRTLKKIELLEREVHRLETILNDFLRFVRAQELHLEPLDVNPLLQEVIDFLDPEARKSKVQIRSQFEAKLPKIPLDKNAFRQAILNLMVNAREAMPQGGELILQTRKNGSFLEIIVTDTGIGMPAEVVAHCFDVYFTTKRSGTGLGLPTTKRIIEEHGGTISVQSDEGRGTRFLLRFPITKE